MSVPLTFLATKTLNSLSLAIWDYAACLIVESVRLEMVDAPLRLTLNRFQPSLNVQWLYDMNQWTTIDNEWIVSMYDHLHPESSWPLNFRTTTIHVISVMDDEASEHSHTFGRQFKLCWFSRYLLINIARIPHLSWSGSFSSISMTYHKQFSNLNHVHQVCAESYAVGRMDECSMTVIIQTDSYCALTTSSLTRMASLTQIVSVDFITNLYCAFPLNCNRTGAMEYIAHLAAKFAH